MTREIHALNKRLLKEERVAHGANAMAYGKFLQRTLRDARTFDSESESYVDYAARSMKRCTKQAETKAARKKSLQADVAQPGKKSKRDEPAQAEDDESVKKRKLDHAEADSQ